MLGKAVTTHDLSVAERAFAALHKITIEERVYLAPIRNGLHAISTDGSKYPPLNHRVALET